MAKLSMKKNLSSMQVLKTLQVLLQGNYTMQELIQILNANEKDAIFNNSVISKYINTCRYCGFDIPKIHNKYFVASLPFGMEFENNEIDLLENIQRVVRNDMTSRSNKLFDNFLEKVNRYSNKKISRVEKDTYQFTSELFESAIRDKRKIKLMLKTRVEMICIPLKIVENKGKTFFHVFYKTRERMIAVERVSGLEITGQKYVHNFNDQVVVYSLDGALATRYSLRENEQLIQRERDGKIVISNRGESKEILFSRLLRYDKHCEILNPKVYREEFKQILDDAIKNYEDA